jgi:hypothetical protein
MGKATFGAFSTLRFQLKEMVMDVMKYKEFEIKASPYQLAESGYWSLNIYITHHKGGETLEKNFSAAKTFKTRDEAVTHCLNFGRKIIDGEVQGCTVADL